MAERLLSYVKKYAIALLFAFLIVTLTSKCSFLYRMNDWVDPNCYFTVGEAMKKGLVLYRDIYEQKGPYVYFLHYLAVCLSNGYIGMYLFEVVAALVAAVFSHKILSLFLHSEKKITIYVIIFLTVYYTSPAFCSGDSVEEMAVPFLLIALYFLVKMLRKEKAMPFYEMMLIGAMSGLVFLSKYTICGTLFAVALMVFVWDIKGKRLGEAFLEIVYFFAGFAIACLPALIYFGVNNAFKEFLGAYFYNNIFLYSAKQKPFIEKILAAFAGYFTSYLYLFAVYILLIWGLLTQILDKRCRSPIFISVLVIYLITQFFLFAGGVHFRYYGLPTAVFALFAILAIDARLEKKPKIMSFVRKCGKRIYWSLIPFVSIFVFLVGDNNYYIFRSSDSYAQIQIAKIINEEQRKGGNVSVYNYGGLDYGIYHLTGLTPPNKYFCQLNIGLEEMLQTQKETLQKGEVAFVVTQDLKIEEITDKYELIYAGKEDKRYNAFKYGECYYYLYKLKEGL